jgi:serine/threonine protein phosphatase PrpC
MGDERAGLDGMGGRQTSNKIRKLIVRNGENELRRRQPEEFRYREAASQRGQPRRWRRRSKR